MAYIKKPYLVFGGYGDHLYPDQEPHIYNEAKMVDRVDHVTSSKSFSYQRSAWDFIEVAFRYQTTALKAEWITFWEAVRSGKPCYYVTDATVVQLGSFTLDGGKTLGQGTDGTQVSVYKCKVENTEFTLSRDPEVGTLWQTPTLRLRILEVME